MTASRALSSSLTSLTLSAAITEGQFTFSPKSLLASPAVDVVKTVWTTNPFGDVPNTDTETTAVFELTVRNSATGVDVKLNSTMDTTESASSSLPVHFWISLDASADAGALSYVLFGCYKSISGILFKSLQS